MKNHRGQRGTGVPAELEALLEGATPVQESLESLRSAPVDFDADPEFVAGFVKARFLEGVLRAMEEQSMTKSGLAHKLGKSRQYIGKLLNERANFTIETMAEIACALKWNLDVRLVRLDDPFEVGTCAIEPVRRRTPAPRVVPPEFSDEIEPVTMESQDGDDACAA